MADVGQVKATDRVTDIHNKLDAGLGAQVVMQAQWLFNLCLFHGHHYVEKSERMPGQTIFQQARKSYDGQIRIVLNVVKPKILGRVARMLEQVPTPVVYPNSKDAEDMKGAAVGEDLLECLQQATALDLRTVTVDTAMWRELAGIAYERIGFDPMAQPTVPVQRQRMNPATGQAEMVEMPPAMGELFVDSIAPYNALLSPGATTINGPGVKASWAIVSTVCSVDNIKDRWGITVSRKSESDAMCAAERQLYSLAGLSPQNIGVPEGFVRVHEYFELPSTKYPLGRWDICTDSKESIYEGSLDIWDYMIPLVEYRGIPVPSMLVGATAIEDLGPANVAINFFLSKAMEHAARAACPAILMPNTGNVNELKQRRGIIGEVIPYDTGFDGRARPEWENIPGLPASIAQLLNVLVQYMDDASSEHEVTRAEAPGQVRSALGIDSLKEADNIPLRPLIESLRSGVARRSKMLLQFAQKFYGEDRILKITGRGRMFKVYSFKGMDIRSNFDVRVPAEPAGYMSREGKARTAAALASTGYFRADDPHYRAVFDRLMGLDTDPDMTEMNAEQRRVDRENDVLDMGLALPVKSWDTDALHIVLHLGRMNADDFDALAPQLEPVYLQHLQGHYEAQAEKQVIAMEQAANMQPRIEETSGTTGKPPTRQLAAPRNTPEGQTAEQARPATESAAATKEA